MPFRNPVLALTSQFNSLDRLVEEVDEIKDTVSLLSQQLNEAEVARANLIQASVLIAIFKKKFINLIYEVNVPFESLNCYFFLDIYATQILLLFFLQKNVD